MTTVRAAPPSQALPLPTLAVLPDDGSLIYGTGRLDASGFSQSVVD